LSNPPEKEEKAQDGGEARTSGWEDYRLKTPVCKKGGIVPESGNCPREAGTVPAWSRGEKRETDERPRANGKKGFFPSSAKIQEKFLEEAGPTTESVLARGKHLLPVVREKNCGGDEGVYNEETFEKKECGCGEGGHALARLPFQGRPSSKKGRNVGRRKERRERSEGKKKKVSLGGSLPFYEKGNGRFGGDAMVTGRGEKVGVDGRKGSKLRLACVWGEKWEWKAL